MPTVRVGLGGLFRLLAPRADWNNRQRFAGFSRRLISIACGSPDWLVHAKPEVLRKRRR
jgi:hypothetical protein